MATRKKKDEAKPQYKLQSNMRFKRAAAEQEYKWACELYDSRKRFVEHVRIALQTRSPTRRKELYEGWRKLYGDDLTRWYAKYAESVYAGNDTRLLDALAKMIDQPPQPIPEYMIVD
ncbi:hypothetical protein UFOVP236_11 [uncultured Caudovirales phage]|uniref:Uncharacterized protein n=1 Tax=uncultured Caudovirales phage TaxID=2100421 RepID=A0A6J7WQR8_9CAUD|nr:hypothetical protein UFOVP236_11 [uncultured Caudovirales phage]